MLIPSSFGSLIQNNKIAAKWLEKLPELIPYFMKRWNITSPQPAPNMTYNYILFGKQESRDIVLKLSWDKDAFLREFHALSAYQTSGFCPKIISRCITRRAILMDRIHPGDPLSTLFPRNEDQANQVFVSILPRLHDCAFDPKSFTPVEDVLITFFKNAPHIFSKEEVQTLQNITTSLLETTTKKVLLHGDLHHDNIISHGNTWIAIDPQGFVGDPACDTGPFMRNPVEKMTDPSAHKDLLLRRAHTLGTQLHFDHHRVMAWGVVQAALAASWDFEDQGRAERWIPIFQTLYHGYQELG